MSKLFVIVLVLFLGVGTASAGESVDLVINGEEYNVGDEYVVTSEGQEEAHEVDIEPQIIDGRTMVPIRLVAGTTGRQVLWNEKTNSVSIIDGETEMAGGTFYAGLHYFLEEYGLPKEHVTIIYREDIQADYQMFEPEVPPKIVDGRTLVPVRFVTELMGAEVDWDPDQRVVSVNLEPIEQEYEASGRFE